MSKEETCGVKVFLRMRPFNTQEACAERGYAFQMYDNCIKDKTQSFVFDKVFAPQSTNQQIYDACTHDIVLSCLQGYNGICKLYFYFF